MLQIHHRFPAHAAAAGAARRAIEGLLAGSSPGPLNDARIVVPELVTYSIFKGGDDRNAWIDLTIKVSRASLRIEVRRGGPGSSGSATAVSKDDSLSDNSRFIVERLADDWGTSPGNEIWAILWSDRGEGTRSRDQEGHRSLSLRS